MVRAASGIDEWTKPAALASTSTRRGCLGVAGAASGSAAIICIRSVTRATCGCGPRGPWGPRAAGGGPCAGVAGAAAVWAESTATEAALETSASIRRDAAVRFMTDTYTAHAPHLGQGEPDSREESRGNQSRLRGDRARPSRESDESGAPAKEGLAITVEGERREK